MRRDEQRLHDVLEALDWIAKAINGRLEADFLSDETLCYAVAQKLTIIGEAVARLSPGNHGAAQSGAVARHRGTPEYSRSRVFRHLLAACLANRG
jgi:hypothetical protein